jgi:hypothetical protein
MADVTLKQGIERTLIQKFEITAVKDSTDHRSKNPYASGTRGRSWFDRAGALVRSLVGRQINQALAARKPARQVFDVLVGER